MRDFRGTLSERALRSFEETDHLSGVALARTEATRRPTILEFSSVSESPPRLPLCAYIGRTAQSPNGKGSRPINTPRSWKGCDDFAPGISSIGWSGGAD